MVTCKYCFGWKPTQYNGMGYDDTEAVCTLNNCAVTAYDHTCPWASMVAPNLMSADARAAYYKEVGRSLAPPPLPVTPSQGFNGANRTDLPRPIASSTPLQQQERPPYREHQVEAVAKLKDLPGSNLFMEMGCGKSATALAIAEYRYEKGDIDALLIIAPNGVHKQWASEEVPKWLRIPYELQCFGGRGGAATTHPFTTTDRLHIVCVNIDTFSTKYKWEDIPEWHNMKRCMIILDEATNIKNPTSKRGERIITGFNDVVRRGKYVVASTSKSVCRVILTGTPVTNSPLDLWAMVEFVSPNYFKRNYYSFRSYYCMMMRINIDGVGKVDTLLSEEAWAAIKQVGDFGFAYAKFGINNDTFNIIMQQEKYEGSYKHLDELRELLEPISYFKTLREVTDIAEPIRNVRKVMMSPEQKKCYAEMMRELFTTYKDSEVTAANKLSMMIRLQQICSGFIPKQPIVEYMDEDTQVVDYNPLEVEWLGKTPKLEMIMQDVETASKPCIVVTKFSCEAARIYEELADTYKCMLYTGWKKTGTIEDFKEGKYEVMVANIASISHGFNLQNSCQMLFYSNTFSLERRLQCEGRIFRLGQKGTCMYTDYVVDDSVEETIMQSLSMKSSLLNYIKGLEPSDLFGGM